MSLMMFRLTAQLVMFLKVVRCDYFFVTALTDNPTFGQSFSLAASDSILYVAAGTQSNIQVFNSSNNGQDWSNIQTLPYITSGSPLQISMSDDGGQILLGSLTGGVQLYSWFEDKFYLSRNPMTRLDPYCQVPSNNIYALTLSGSGYFAFTGGFCSLDHTFGDPFGILFFAGTMNAGVGDFKISIPYAGGYFLAQGAATNYDGSVIVLSVSNAYVAIYRAPDFNLATYFLYSIGADSLSLTSDGSILAIGTCGQQVSIYDMTNLTSPIQVLTNGVYFGCNVDFSDDGSRLIVGSNTYKPNGFAYAYKKVGGMYILESKLTTPTFDPSFGGGGVAIINTPQNEGIALVGGPGAGTGSTGQIAVFRSVVPSVTPVATATASSTLTSSATAPSTLTSSPTASATFSSSATATLTNFSFATFSMTTSPSSSAAPNSFPGALASSATIYEITAGIAISGGVVGSLIGLAAYRWLCKRVKQSSKLNGVKSINTDDPLLYAI